MHLIKDKLIRVLFLQNLELVGLIKKKKVNDFFFLKRKRESGLNLIKTTETIIQSMYVSVSKTNKQKTKCGWHLVKTTKTIIIQKHMRTSLKKQNVDGILQKRQKKNFWLQKIIIQSM